MDRPSQENPPHAPHVPGLANPGSGAVGHGVNRHGLYLRVLTWSFAFFSTVRVIAYLPTVWALHQSGDSSQHSLWTWLCWFGANLTTAAWLYEKDGHVLGRVALVSAGNAAMCLAISLLIIWYRL